MSRCPAIVAVVTVAPVGQRFDPRDVKLTVAPTAVETPYRWASHASVRVPAASAAAVGCSPVKSPMKQTSCANP